MAAWSKASAPSFTKTQNADKCSESKTKKIVGVTSTFFCRFWSRGSALSFGWRCLIISSGGPQRAVTPVMRVQVSVPVSQVFYVSARKKEGANGQLQKKKAQTYKAQSNSESDKRERPGCAPNAERAANGHKHKTGDSICKEPLAASIVKVDAMQCNNMRSGGLSFPRTGIKRKWSAICTLQKYKKHNVMTGTVRSLDHCQSQCAGTFLKLWLAITVKEKRG